MKWNQWLTAILVVGLVIVAGCATNKPTLFSQADVDSNWKAQTK